MTLDYTKKKNIYISRTAEKLVLQTHNTFPVLLITGPRQVGKTTLLKEMANSVDEDFKYVTLDSLETRALAKEDPALFIQRFSPPVLIDEIQYAPELLSFIKQEADARNTNGLYWITGSQQFSLMHNVTESLAGRAGIITLLGLSAQEIAGNPHSSPFIPSLEYLSNKDKTVKPLTSQDVFTAIWKGSFPRLITTPGISWEQFYDSYISTYIERDIRSLTAVTNVMKFSKFIRICAARTGQLLNYSDIAKETDISLPTAKAWLSILISSGLVYLLEPYFTNIEKRIVKTPKLYFLDTGLAAYLTGWQTPSTLELGAMNGAFFETYAVSQLLKGYYHNGKKPNIYFFRDHDQKEIDVIIEQNGLLYPIEIKAKMNPSKDDVKQFKLLSNKKTGSGYVICLCKTHLPITENTHAFPIWYL